MLETAFMLQVAYTCTNQLGQANFYFAVKSVDCRANCKLSPKAKV